MSVEKTLHLDQSLKIMINGDLKTTGLDSDEEFQNILNDELESRNLEIDPSINSPIFSPSEVKDDLIKNVDSITYAVKPKITTKELVDRDKEFQGFEISIFETNISSQLEKLIKKSNEPLLNEMKAMTKEIFELKDSVKELKNDIKESNGTKYMREIIRNLKVREIKNILGVNLSRNDKNFEQDFRHYCDEMYKKYKDPNHQSRYLLYLHNLFTYKTSDLNSEMHPDIDRISIDEIKEAIEVKLEIEDLNNANHSFITFFERYKTIRNGN